MPNYDLAKFIIGMDFIIENKCQRILKNGYGFIKTDSMFPYVCCCFL